MLNNILISRETREVISKDEVFIGMEGENLQEVLIFNLDEQIEGNAIIEILFPDESTAYIEIEKTERGYELPVKSSLLTQNGIVKMQLRIIQAGQEIFKSDLIRFKVKESINATTTIPEDYPTWIDNLEALKLNLENAEKERVKAEEGRIDAEKAREETFNQMGQDVDNAIGNIVDLQEAYDKNAADKIKEFNDNAGNKLKEHNTNATNKITEFNENATTQTNAFNQNVQDKTDEFDKNAQEKLDEYNKNSEALENRIVELETQIIDLETENENIKNQIPVGEAEGENITISDSSDMEFKELRIGGNSWQETRSGKNKLIPAYLGNKLEEMTIDGVTLTPVFDENGSLLYINANGTATSNVRYKYADEVNRQSIEQGDYILTGATNGSDATYKLVLGLTGIKEYYQYNEPVNINVAEDNTIYFIIIIYNGVTVNNVKFYPMLRPANTDDTYEPYGAMPSQEFPSEIKNVTGDVSITVCNENFFNPNITFDGFINDVDGTYQTGNNANCSDYIKIEGGETYYIGPKLSSGNWGAWYDKDKKFIAGISGYDKVFEAPNNAYYLRVTVSFGDSNPDYKHNFYVVKSNVKVPYIPHQSQQFTFPLSEGQKMYKDSYLADDGVHHNRMKVVFDGNEKWRVITENNLPQFVMDLSILAPSVSNEIQCLSNFYKGCSRATIMDKNNQISVSGTYIRLRDDRYTTVEEFKAHLAEQYANGTPVTVEYELAKEVIEPYTEEQQKVYNEINKAHSYKNVTHIFSTDEIKPIVKTIYRKDWETINQKQEDRILALENAVLGGN